MKVWMIIAIIVLIVIVGMVIVMSSNNEGKTGFRIMIVGEKGQEYIIPTWMMEREDVKATVAQLEQIRTEQKLYPTMKRTRVN